LYKALENSGPECLVGLQFRRVGLSACFSARGRLKDAADGIRPFGEEIVAFKKLGVASLTALVAFAAFIVFSPKHESSGRNAAAPPSDEHTTSSAPGSPPEDVARLMDQEAVLNDKCRDGVGDADDKATQKVCEARDIILGEIKTKGWCWGHDGQIGADRNWEPCQQLGAADERKAAAVPDSPPEDVTPQMGVDGLAGGQADDKWQTVQSDGQEIFVMTNGYYSGSVFRTYIVANLPESDVVGAPQSVMHEIEGNCETRRYHVLGHLFFAGKNRSGMAMESTPPEDFERELVPNSPFEKAFDMLCKPAKERMASLNEAAFRNLSKNWRNVTASNGQVYEIAMDTIDHNLPNNVEPVATLRAATVVVYGPQEKPFNANNVQHLYFDCRGHFQTFQQDWSPVADIPALSVAAEVASIACDNSAH
jgi:Surface-adhesin protein E